MQGLAKWANVYFSFLFVVSSREARITIAHHDYRAAVWCEEDGRNLRVARVGGQMFIFPFCLLFQAERHALLVRTMTTAQQCGVKKIAETYE